MSDYSQGEEVLSQAMKYLIDIDSGCFERLLMAAKEVFSLKSSDLNEDGVSAFLEIDAMFDKNLIHETQGFCWQNIMEMPDDKKQELAEKIFNLYSIMCKASELQRITIR